MTNTRYSTPLGFSSLFAFCGLPLRLDAYKGCAFRCTYCFARARESVEGTPQVKPADPKAFPRLLQRVFVEKSESLSVVSKCIQHRVPVHLGGMSDPFQEIERRFRVSLSYLKSAAEFQYPLVISTRGSLIAESPYLELLREHRASIVRLSMSTTEDHRSYFIERNEVRPSVILRTMEKLSRVGIRVTCRWQPYVPGLSEAPEIFAKRVANAGCQQFSFEFLRLPRERNPRLIRGFHSATGQDIYDRFLSTGAVHQVREYILPQAIRLPIILQARSAAHACGMRFASADNDFQYLSDSACCCSGADQFPGFEHFFRHQIGYAVRQSIGRRIEYSSIAREWAPSGSVDRYLNSCRAKFGTVTDHIARRWNTSKLEGAPDSFFGVEPTEEFTSDGMRVCQWNREKLAQLGLKS